MRIDFSFDVETLALTNDCHILSIGCARFDIESGDIIDTFYSKVSGYHQQNGRKIDIDVVSWWMAQNSMERINLFENSGQPTLRRVLLNLGDWIYGQSDDQGYVKVWGNGSYFDISILESAFRTESIAQLIPWKFFNVFDVRTIVDAAAKIAGFNKQDVIRKGTHHNALDDAIYQANLICCAYKKLMEMR